MIADVKALVRYGQTWLGHGHVTHEPKADGYWTPWHIAAERIETLSAALTAQAEEIERLRKLTYGQWFYPPDNYDQERCMWSVDEVIDYCDLEPGHHVIEVNVATPLPSIWCTVHVTSDEDADERFTFTEHATEDQARAALKAAQEVKA